MTSEFIRLSCFVWFLLLLLIDLFCSFLALCNFLWSYGHTLIMLYNIICSEIVQSGKNCVNLFFHTKTKFNRKASFALYLILSIFMKMLGKKFFEIILDNIVRMWPPQMQYKLFHHTVSPYFVSNIVAALNRVLPC